MRSSLSVLAIASLLCGQTALAEPAQQDPHAAECDIRIQELRKRQAALARALAEAPPDVKAVLDTDAGAKVWKTLSEPIVRPDLPGYCLAIMISQAPATVRVPEPEPPALRRAGLPKGEDEPPALAAQVDAFFRDRHPDVPAPKRDAFLRDTIRALAPEALQPR